LCLLEGFPVSCVASHPGMRPRSLLSAWCSCRPGARRSALLPLRSRPCGRPVATRSSRFGRLPDFQGGDLRPTGAPHDHGTVHGDRARGCFSDRGILRRAVNRSLRVDRRNPGGDDRRTPKTRNSRTPGSPAPNSKDALRRSGGCAAFPTYGWAMLCWYGQAAVSGWMVS
jgi:hypothetical protein